MRVELVRIGNSRGIRIPKPIIKECGFGNTVELRVENHYLVIAADEGPRQGWEEAFAAAGPSSSGGDLLLEGIANEFDQREWRW